MIEKDRRKRLTNLREVGNWLMQLQDVSTTAKDQGHDASLIQDPSSVQELLDSEINTLRKY